jgi:mannose-6-phosphate isomerase-like protein (cupin superfamily)
MPANIYRITCLLSLLSMSALAQQAPAPAVATAAPDPDRMFTSAAEIAQGIVKAEAAYKAGKPSDGIRTLAAWGPFQGHLIYRGAPRDLYFVNEDYAEFYVILEGTGAMTMGSKLVNPKRTGPHLESTTATGGVPYRVAKGDMVMVPPATAHRLSQVNGRLVYMSMHLPLHPKLPATASKPSNN